MKFNEEKQSLNSSTSVRCKVGQVSRIGELFAENIQPHSTCSVYKQRISELLVKHFSQAIDIFKVKKANITKLYEDFISTQAFNFTLISGVCVCAGAYFFQ